ncbi:hypothetical protein CN575_02555 [Bacillus wiedmannii]|uniref:hypothetical protein n=1 Tax=Bacillus wiedmannii TaxID=1890302 RepID=UPI000BF5C4BE|nr:hypothetical protein [Bacillus wiedmannii]PEP36669.1 hypothetical protein CN575_02555 [Bacillus wiedmannii]
MIEQLQSTIDAINELRSKDRLYMNQKTFEKASRLVEGVNDLKVLGLIIITNYIPDNQVVKFHDKQIKVR